MWWPYRCNECGRFTGYLAESSTPFGGPTDYEPPEEEFFCPRCVRKLQAEAIESGFLPCNWRTAAWEARAAAVLGYVQAGPKGAAWTFWRRREEIPEGWVFQPEPKTGSEQED